MSWSFEFENQPWYYGFRDLATNGVDKPVLNVFWMFGMMSGTRVVVQSNRMYPLDKIFESGMHGPNSDIGGLATTNKRSTALMIWNYHDDDKPAPAEMVNITMVNVPATKATMKVYMIDKENSNSYELWKKMGSPQNPTPQQITELEQAGKLKCITTTSIKISKGKVNLPLQLERQAVALVRIDW